MRPRLGRTVNVNDGAVPDLTDALPIASAFETAGHSDRPPQGLRTPRDDRYNRWRFQSHPTARYGWVQGEKRGGAIVRTSVRGRYPELIVSDLYDPDDETALALTLAHHRTRYVAAAFTGGPELSAARDVGLRHFPRVNGLHLVANVLTDIDIDITQLASWDLAMSDLELL